MGIFDFLKKEENKEVYIGSVEIWRQRYLLFCCIIDIVTLYKRNTNNIKQ